MKENHLSMPSNSDYNKNERIVKYIIKIVENYYDVPENYYFSRTRQSKIIQARQIAIYLILKYSTETLMQVGLRFDRDHSTIIHSKRMIENMIKTYTKVKKQVQDIENLIKLNNISTNKSVHLNNEFYYIDFNDHHSIKINNTKGIILTGFSEIEKSKILEVISDVLEQREHVNTGLYILEKK